MAAEAVPMRPRRATARTPEVVEEATADQVVLAATPGTAISAREAKVVGCFLRL
jgi:hypothetical protein